MGNPSKTDQNKLKKKEREKTQIIKIKNGKRDISPYSISIKS